MVDCTPWPYSAAYDGADALGGQDTAGVVAHRRRRRRSGGGAAAHRRVRIGRLWRRGPDSDIDLLVVLDRVEPGDRARLAGAIRRAISVRAPIDVFVTDLAEYERRKDVIGSMAYWPEREGEIVYERAA